HCPGVSPRRPLRHAHTPGRPGGRLVRAPAPPARPAAGDTDAQPSASPRKSTRLANRRNPVRISRRAFISTIAATAMAGTTAVANAQTVLTVSGWTPPKHHFTQLMQNEWAKMVESE